MPHARTHLNRRLRILVLIAAALMLPGLASGEDIDLYTGVPISGGKPNLIMLLDNSKAWDSNSASSDPYFGCSTSVVSGNNSSKAVGFEQCALYTAVTAIGTNTSLAGNINMGLMLFDANSNGGKFNYPAMPPPSTLPTMDATGVANLQTAIKALDRQSSGANNAATAGIMQEAWAYYSGHTGISGTNYSSAKAITDKCQKNFVVYIANASNSGSPQDTGTIDTAAGLTANGATATPAQKVTIPIPNTKAPYVNNWGDEWARYMYQTDVTGNNQNIITYTIAVVSPGNQYNQDYVNFLRSMASNGGGKAFVVTLGDTAALVDALSQIFNEVQATNSVFASVSLPISVNAQGTSLNQVYVGMFRPARGARPRWYGNLKQYQLGFDTNNDVVLQDSLGKAAISNSGTGFISPNALSYWTTDHQTGTLRDGPLTFSSSGPGTSIIPNWPTNGFWNKVVPNMLGASGNFDAPDGEIVEKGGAGEMLRADYLTSQLGRSIYTCSSTSGCPTTTTTPLPAFDSSTVTATDLGTSSTTETSNLINWIRGADNTNPNNEDELGPGSLVTIRPSVHGDVLHSRPAIVNYGGTTGIVVFYGANDGFFRAINGNQTAGIGGVRPGGELWSFIAPEFFQKFKRLRDNYPLVALPGITDSTVAPKPKDYFFDGTTTVFQDLSGTKPKVYIYLTARRGGRFIYAFDVSDPTKPPIYMWSRRGTPTDLPELGQTWSQPKLALVHGNTNPVVIMGGGYDPAEDTDPVAAADTMGRAIVVLDAIKGTTVWTACKAGCTLAAPGMTYAIPADVTLLDRDGDGYTDRLYTGDLGGNIWRADINDASPANWTVTQIASLGGTGTSARKFFYPPDVTPTTSFDAVVAASGDREHPLLANASSTVVNRFYMLKDTNTGTSVAANWTTITESVLTDETGAAAGTTPPYSSTSTTSGFYVTLGTSGDGEKAVNAPLTVAGYTYFGTNTPFDPKKNPDMCYPNLGIARGYAINFLTGAGLNSNGYITFDGGGLPPSPVFGLVEVTPNTGVYTPVLIGGGNQTGPAGGNNSSALGANKVNPPNTGKRKRTYWFTEGLK
jgi:type IV pilus assembly protein PilY1